jgi:hypothetical protein
MTFRKKNSTICYEHSKHPEVKVLFVSDSRVPGFTHKVVVQLNGEQSIHWLSHTHKPSAKTAAFFYGEHQKTYSKGILI